MEIIIRTIEEWTQLLVVIDQLKKKYGSSIVKKAILEMDCLLNNKIVAMESWEMFRVLYQAKFHDLEQTKKFLIAILDIYRFSDIIEEMNTFKERFGINYIAFILNTETLKKIPTYITLNGYQKVYFSKDVIPWYQYRWDTNGVDEYIFYNQAEFIVDYQDFIHKQKSRTLYTCDFRFRMATLPLKHIMDSFQMELERKFLFTKVLENLENYDIHFILQNPNGNYYKESSICHDQVSTIRCDGTMYSDMGYPLFPSKEEYDTSKILVKNASFVAIAKMLKREVKDIYIIADPIFMEQYFNFVYCQNDVLLKKAFDKLLEHQISTNMERLLLN